METRDSGGYGVVRGAGRLRLVASAGVAASPTAVAARGVGRRFGPVVALSGIELTVRRGELFGLVGPHGAGKSTLLEAVAGVRCVDGTLTVLGVDARDPAAAARAGRRLAFVSQPVGATALQQRVAICAALVDAPDLLLVDEPTVGLDPVARDEIWDLVRALVRERGMTAIVATTDPDEGERCDRLAFVDGGRLIAVGSPALLRATAPLRVREFVPSDARAAVAALDALGLRCTQAAGRVRVVTEPAGDARLGGVAVLGREVPPRNARLALDEVFAARLVALRGPAPAFVPCPVPPVTTGPPSPAVEVLRVGKRFGACTAVEDVAFAVERGSIVGLLGPRGSGKTTLLQMIGGRLAPSAGGVRVAGVDVARADRALHRRIAFVSEPGPRYHDVAVAEMLALHGVHDEVSGARHAERLAWVLDQAELCGREGERVGRLAAGQRQRLALGCALLSAPEVLLLDAPTAGVDPLAHAVVWRTLRDLAHRLGVTVLVATRDARDADCCDRVAWLDAGRLVAFGTPDALRAEVARRRGRAAVVEGEDRRAARA